MRDEGKKLVRASGDLIRGKGIFGKALPRRRHWGAEYMGLVWLHVKMASTQGHGEGKTFASDGL